MALSSGIGVYGANTITDNGTGGFFSGGGSSGGSGGYYVNTSNSFSGGALQQAQSQQQYLQQQQMMLGQMQQNALYQALTDKQVPPPKPKKHATFLDELQAEMNGWLA